VNEYRVSFERLKLASIVVLIDRRAINRKPFCFACTVERVKKERGGKFGRGRKINSFELLKVQKN
jgi:hypothetical protein